MNTRPIALLLAALTGCAAATEPSPPSAWTVASYRDQYAFTNPPAGCLRVCMVDGDGCAMLGPDGEHVRCAEGDDPLMTYDDSFGTCTVTAEPCTEPAEAEPACDQR